MQLSKGLNAVVSDGYQAKEIIYRESSA